MLSVFPYVLFGFYLVSAALLVLCMAGVNDSHCLCSCVGCAPSPSGVQSVCCLLLHVQYHDTEEHRTGVRVEP